jgi:hypothetical protein
VVDVTTTVIQPTAADTLADRELHASARCAGRIALARGPRTTATHQHETEEERRFHQEIGRLPEGELPFSSK